jgi:hypothetical protein
VLEANLWREWAEMDSLTKAIVDTTALIKDLFVRVASGEGNIAAQDQETLWDSLSSIAQNLVSFFTEIVGEIAAKF